MFDKDKFIEYIEKLNLNKEDFIIVAGGSLLLQGIKEYTEDVDLYVNEDGFNTLSKSFDIRPSNKEYTNHYTVNDKLEVVLKENLNELDYTTINGYKCSTIEYEYEGDAYYLYTSEVNSSKTVRIETKPTYSISVSSTTENATISSSANSVYEGESVTITVNTQDISEISIKDNNTDISSLFSGSNGVYTYTFNANAIHNIIVSEVSSNKNFIKLNDNWTQIYKIYKKESNVWVEKDSIISAIANISNLIVFNN